MIDWHRLFGLFLMDYFSQSPFVVELEKDLSLKRQFLDVVILRKDSEGVAQELPDGLDNLKNHNLLSYKSLREPFDDWALKELVGHYVNYRKQVSPSWDALPAEDQFQLYGVSTRFPQKLSGQVELQAVSSGVYDILWGTDRIRLIVLSEIPPVAANALWNLFSANPERVGLAAGRYHVRQAEMSTIVGQLFENYQLEGVAMPYTIQDFQKDFVRDHLNLLSPDEVLRRYSPEDVLRRYSPEEVLRRYSANERLKDLSPAERLKDLSPAERLKGLSLDEIKAWLEKQS